MRVSIKTIADERVIANLDLPSAQMVEAYIALNGWAPEDVEVLEGFEPLTPSDPVDG